MAHAIDMIGQRFGRLTVVEKAAITPDGKGASWRCVCDCGNEKVVRGTSLRRGDYKSCGCISKERIALAKEKNALAKQKSVGIKLQYIKNDPDWKKKRESHQKKQRCPYNDGCHCHQKDCWKCGWNPKVDQARREKMGYGD